MYFLEIDFKLHKYSIVFFSAVFGIIFGIVLGIFVGALASALAETLNVIPVATRKLRVKNYMFYIITSMVLGKIFGSLIYWLFLI
jgi:stage V sporulation protein AB